MHTIAIMNRKGGVGKTTTAQNVARGLMQRGYKVLAIDLDSQANLTFSYRASEALSGTYSLLYGENEAEKLIQRTDNGDIISASEILSAAGDDKSVKLGALSSRLSSLSALYDYIIIDTAPSLDRLTIGALIAADSVIITAQADSYSIKAIAQIAKTIEESRKAKASLDVMGILLTRYNPRTSHGKDLAEQAEAAAQHLGTKLFNTKIRECTALREAQTARLSIFDYAPKSNGAADYSALIDEIIERRAAR